MLLQQSHHALRALIGLGQHGRARLDQDIVLRKLGAFFRHVHIFDAAVRSRKIVFQNAELGIVGTLVEQGNAVAEAGGALWKYTATAANTVLSGDKIVIKVSDIPGNLTQDEKLI